MRELRQLSMHRSASASVGFVHGHRLEKLTRLTRLLPVSCRFSARAVDYSGICLQKSPPLVMTIALSRR